MSFALAPKAHIFVGVVPDKLLLLKSKCSSSLKLLNCALIPPIN